MTTLALTTLVSLAAILGLVRAMPRLGLGRIDPLDKASARAWAEALEPGLTARAVRLDPDARGAKIATDAGPRRLALHGNRYVLRPGP